VFGRLWIGPTCPVLREGEDCADEPYQARLEVRDARGGLSARQRSDENGFFRIPLPPGEYFLLPEVPENGGPPWAGPIVFYVREQTWTELTVSYDSGIR
jgi:hypothetical protein